MDVKRRYLEQLIPLDTQGAEESAERGGEERPRSAAPARRLSVSEIQS
jgi:hypothetical protein